MAKQLLGVDKSISMKTQRMFINSSLIIVTVYCLLYLNVMFRFQLAFLCLILCNLNIFSIF